jgi:hypothetical protein
MLSNVRIRDTRRLVSKRERSGIETGRLRPKKAGVSPFSQLALANGRVLESGCSPSSPIDDNDVDALSESIKSCSLRNQTPSARPQERTSLLQESPDDHGEKVSGGGPSPAALQPAPAGVAVKRAVVRLERRSLQELLAEHTPVTGSGGGKRTTIDQLTPIPALSTPHSTARTPLTPITATPIHHLPSLSFSSPLLTYLSPVHGISLSPRDKVLGLCGQTQPLPLTDFFTQQMVESVHKLGEGTFSEVFGCVSDTGTQLAVKVIPIEGDQLYNDERQTTYEEVLTEMVITKELSQLGDIETQENSSHFTENFLKIHQVTLAQGEYPAFLLKSWDSYAKTHVVENDRPDSFPAEQLYVVMAAENAGSSLENYQFSSVEEAVSVVGQVAGALAVGETVSLLPPTATTVSLSHTHTRGCLRH